MHVAILTFQGFNELDSLIALGILNRVSKPHWRVSIASRVKPVEVAAGQSSDNAPSGKITSVKPNRVKSRTRIG